MECRNCHTVNPTGAKFCYKCGQPLALTCANCGQTLPPEASFCFNCGHPVADAPATPPPQPEPPGGRLHRYIPSELRRKLESARRRGEMVGERRVVTMLFCDVKGSTAAAERLDPEEWTEIINGAFEYMIRPVYKYEGTVTRLMGDAILAFFGAPMAHEDDPRRAVLAGLEIVDGISDYRDQVAARWEIGFDVRVGINTGLVVVGEVGNDLRVEYTAMGDAINLAARMEQTAVPGSVQISEETFRRVTPFVEVEAVGDIEVKGKAQPVKAYRVLRVRGAPGLLAGGSQDAAPLVGREAEIDALRNALADVQQGVGQIVALIGEAGIGKSRLVRELYRASAASADWYEAASLSYESDQPYSLFQALLRELAGVSPNDAPERFQEQLAALVVRLDPEARESARRALLTLFNVAPADGLEGEAFKRQLFATMEAIWRRWTGEGPAVFVLDDLHWSDPASVELLLHLLPLVESAPLLLLCVFRPDRRSSAWQLKTTAERDLPHRYRELSLEPLSPSEGGRLITNLTDIIDLPAEVSGQIMALTEGNPFFIEEVVQELVAQGGVAAGENGARWVGGRGVADVRIPGSLQSLLLARIDRLEEEARYVVQVASVIGRRFYYRVLVAIVAMERELDHQLSQLQQEQLIQETARIPEREYVFRHALTQEAAYRNILRRQRRAFHQRVGEALERLFPERLEEMAPLLAHHFEQAGDGRAGDYYRLAGDRAARLYANTEAAGHYGRSLELALADEATAAETLSVLYRRHGRALEHIGRFDEALATYEAFADQAQEREDDAMLLAALVEQAKLRATATDLYDFDAAQSLLDRALPIAERTGDRAAQGRILWLRLNNHRLVGRDAEALEVGERALAIMRALAPTPEAGPGLREQLAYVLNDLAHVVRTLGDLRRGATLTAEASELWRELDNQAMLADSLATAVLDPVLSGDYKRAIAMSDEAFALSQSIDNVWNQSFSRLVVGIAYHHLGQTAQAIERTEEAIRLGDEAGFPVPRVFSRPIIASVFLDLGAYERAESLLHEILEMMPDTFGHLAAASRAILAELYLETGRVDKAATEAVLIEDHDLRTEFWRGGTQLGRLALAQGRMEEAYEMLTEHGRQLTAMETGAYIALVDYWRARALLALERRREAGDLLRQARERATQHSQRMLLWRILALLAKLADDPAEAAALRAEAGAIIAYIADHAPPDLRQTFLDRPDVAPLVA